MPPSLRLIVAPALALLALGFSACKENSASSTTAPPPAIHVESVTVAQQPMPRVLQLTGNLRGQHETDLAANAAGRVLATFVERGAEVKKGDILAKLDIRAASLGAAEAKAAAELARTQASNAKRDCGRYEKLFQEGRISQAEYDRISDQCRTTPLSVAASEARAQAAAIVVGDGMIRAPFGGVVTERFIEVGQYVRQDTKVAALVDLEQLQARVHRTRSQPLVGQRGQPRVLHRLGLPRIALRRAVKYIGAAVRATTRDLVAEAVVTNPDKVLRPGMFASVALQIGEQRRPWFPSSQSPPKKDDRTCWSSSTDESTSAWCRPAPPPVICWG